MLRPKDLHNVTSIINRGEQLDFQVFRQQIGYGFNPPIDSNLFPIYFDLLVEGPKTNIGAVKAITGVSSRYTFIVLQ